MTETEEPYEIPIEDTIDLHPFQPREVRTVVEEYLYQAARKGLTEVRILHGWGIGVQREIVRAVLGTNPNVIGFADLPARGSTLASLRPSTSDGTASS